MSEIHARILGTDEMITITDGAPLESAKLFKSISDEIWDDPRHDQSSLSFRRVASVVTAEEARDIMNGAVRGIDEGLVISGIGKALDIGPRHYGGSEHVIVEPEILDNPDGAEVLTSNWDKSMSQRKILHNGEEVIAEFTDGHKDYCRELEARIATKSGIINYTMQRTQEMQEETTQISLSMFHFDFAQTGYDGHLIALAEPSEIDELRVLKAMAQIAGIDTERRHN